MILYDKQNSYNLYHNRYLKKVIHRYKKKTINKKIKNRKLKSLKNIKNNKIFHINNSTISEILLNNVKSIFKNIRNKNAYTQYMHIPKKSKETTYIEPYLPENATKAYGILWNNIGFPLDRKGKVIKKYNGKLLKRLPRYFVDF